MGNAAGIKVPICTIGIGLLIFIALIYNYWPTQKLAHDTKVDYLLVEKSKRTMKAYSHGQLLKIYRIAIGKNPQGHKNMEGDYKTPEGIYTINDRNPSSGYHKNLGISYPSKQDCKAAAKIGRSPGGAIKIHGLRNGLGFIHQFHRLFNWTNGCIAITDSEMDELYEKVIPNAKIEIKP